jgi:diguanylate cyclase (GGDEF)-like protein
MIVVENMRDDPLYKDTPSEWQGSIIGIPLIDKNIVVGVMTLAKLTIKKFASKEITTLNHLADQAARVIQNANVHSYISLQAFTDPLTALPNRRSFDWEANKILEQSTRYEHPFTVAMLDLNGFKRINDSYGHAIGDDCLRIITHCMKSSIRKTDFIARYGGDEFIILFPETGGNLAAQVAEKLRKRVAHCQIPINPEKIESLTISYGLATFPDDGIEIKNLIELADHRLYLVKEKMMK